jgi:hypothetical protein
MDKVIIELGNFSGKNPNVLYEIGIASINFIKMDKISVVQQVIQGSVKGTNVILRGVNYSYVERGNSINYLLDTFSLTYDKPLDMLSGSKTDTKGSSTNVILRRNQ